LITPNFCTKLIKLFQQLILSIAGVKAAGVLIDIFLRRAHPEKSVLLRKCATG